MDHIWIGRTTAFAVLSDSYGTRPLFRTVLDESVAHRTAVAFASGSTQPRPDRRVSEAHAPNRTLSLCQRRRLYASGQCRGRLFVRTRPKPHRHYKVVGGFRMLHPVDLRR